ncbi:MAG TPA: DUF2254 family protein [Pyrinomonadaceae bacterium]
MSEQHNTENDISREQIDDERRGLVERLEDWLETPLLILGFVWLVLLIIELTGNLSPGLELLATTIWIAFMLTVAALTFSLTLNAISQASGQFTPRIFRNFMRDRANQFVLGYFVSVFAFCLLVHRTIRGADELKFVPSLAVMAGLLLAIGGILVLVFFIHHIAASLQITTILDNITEETKNAVEKLFPEELGDDATSEEKKEARDTFQGKLWKNVPAPEGCYVQHLDTDGLLQFAFDRRLPENIRAKNDIPLVAVKASSFHDYVDTALDQIRISGKGNQAIFERLLSALIFIGECTTAKDRRTILERKVELIDEYAALTLSTDYEKNRFG